MHERMNLPEHTAERKQVHFRAAFEVIDLEFDNPGLGEGEFASHLAVDLLTGYRDKLAASGEIVRAFVEVAGGDVVVPFLALPGGPALT